MIPAPSETFSEIVGRLVHSAKNRSGFFPPVFPPEVLQQAEETTLRAVEECPDERMEVFLPEVGVAAPWIEFVRQNSDGMGGDEVAELKRSLLARGVAVIGGGAAGETTIVRTGPLDSLRDVVTVLELTGHLPHAHAAMLRATIMAGAHVEGGIFAERVLWELRATHDSYATVRIDSAGNLSTAEQFNGGEHPDSYGEFYRMRPEFMERPGLIHPLPLYSENITDYPADTRRLARLATATFLNVVATHCNPGPLFQGIDPEALRQAIEHLHAHAAGAPELRRSYEKVVGDRTVPFFSERVADYKTPELAQVAKSLNKVAKFLWNGGDSDVVPDLHLIHRLVGRASGCPVVGKLPVPAMSNEQRAARFIELEDALPALVAGTPLAGRHHLVLRADDWSADDQLGRTLRELDTHRIALFGKLGVERTEELLAGARERIAEGERSIATRSGGVRR